MKNEAAVICTTWTHRIGGLLLNSGPAKKVTVSVMEGEQYHGAAVYAAVLDFLFYRGISDATVTRGIAGFGADHKLHTTRLLDLADKMPIKIEFIESAEKVDEVLPKLTEIAKSGFIEIQDTTVFRPERLCDGAERAGASSGKAKRK